MINRVAVAHVDPADVGAVNVTGADKFADNNAVGGAREPVGPADVGAPGVFVGGVNG